VYERIAAHDPSGAAEAMVTHIPEVRLVRRGTPGDPVCLDLASAPAAPRYGMALGLVSVPRPRAPSPYER
jgi:hypothetical protein